MPKDEERRGAQEAAAPPSRSVQQERPPDADQGGRGPSVEPPHPRRNGAADGDGLDAPARRTTRPRRKPDRPRILNEPPEGVPWTWTTNDMYATLTFRALGISARRTLDRLLVEHGAHGGQENGNLAAPTADLVGWGVTADDIPRAFAELIATGLVDRTFEAPRLGAGGKPSRYALTWLPTRTAAGREKPPSHRWATVAAQLGSLDLAGVRRWLSERPGCGGRAWTKRRR
jgi:hypothetical protein